SVIKTFPIFLSSLCGAAPGLKDLRAKIYQEVGQKASVYVDEQFKFRNVSQQDDLEAADELIARIREATVFICILAGSSHGTLMNIGSLRSRTSFFEIELYQAALLKKEVHVFVRNDFVPDRI